MKRHIIIAGVVLLALAACSQNELIERAPDKEIGFSTPAVTKGTGINSSSQLEAFYATALIASGDNTYDTYFSNAKYFEAVDYFVSNPSYYWPDEETTLTFAAYAPEMSTPAVQTDDSKDVVLKNITQDDDISKHKDLITAVATGSETANASNGISITFEHRTCQIEVKAKNTNSEYIYKIKGYRIGNVLAKGDFYIMGEKWEMNTEDKSTYTCELSEGVTVTGSMTGIFNGDNAFILPQESLTNWDPANPSSGGSYLGILINITTKDGSQVYPGGDVGLYDWVAVPFGLTKFEAGTKYIFELDFSNGAGWVAPDLKDSANNTPGTKIGEELVLTRSVNDWTGKPMPMNQEILEIAGVWKLYYFSQQNYDDNGVLEEGIYEINCDTASENVNPETGQTYKNEAIAVLKELGGMFYYMRIPITGSYIIPLDDEGNESNVRSELEYKDKKLYIQGLATENGWTIPEVETIEEDTENPGQKIITLKIDRPSDHIQRLKFHFIPVTL